MLRSFPILSEAQAFNNWRCKGAPVAIYLILLRWRSGCLCNDGLAASERTVFNRLRLVFFRVIYDHLA